MCFLLLLPFVVVGMGSIAIRVVAMAILVATIPLMIIPPFTCLYPLLFLLVLRGGTDIPDDVIGKLANTTSIASLIKMKEYTDLPSNIDMSKLSVFFSEAMPSTTGGEEKDVSSEDRKSTTFDLSSQKVGKKGIEAKATCSVKLETDNHEYFHTSSNKTNLFLDFRPTQQEEEEELTDVLGQSITEVLSEFFSTYDSSYDLNSTIIDISNTIVNPIGSTKMLDVNFTVSRIFPCTSNEHQSNIDCEEVLAQANEFIHDTEVSLKESTISGYLSSLMNDHGTLSDANNVNSMVCESIDAKYIL